MHRYIFRLELGQVIIHSVFLRAHQWSLSGPWGEGCKQALVLMLLTRWAQPPQYAARTATCLDGFNTPAKEVEKKDFSISCLNGMHWLEQ